MTNRANVLADISMISANYGNLPLAEAIHKDWFRFLGGRPGEVVFVENGSPFQDQALLFEGVKKGWITKLLSVRPGAYDIGKHQAYIAEISALAMATRPLVLLYHLDVLVGRHGHDEWLVDAYKQLLDPKVFAIGGSFNAPAKYADLDADWYLSKKLSGNFALLPRARYQESWLRVASEFLRSGFREEHPLPMAARRFIMEVGLERMLASNDWFTRVRRESPDWNVFHTNLNGEQLAQARARFLTGRGVDAYLNAGDVLMRTDNEFKVRYFGQPEPSRIKQLRVAVGASPLGPIYRRILGRPSQPAVEEPVDPPTLRDLVSTRHSPLDDLAVVVWADDPKALDGGLENLFSAVGGRPGQVLVLASALDPAVDHAWQAHVDGRSDKLVVSRSLPVGAVPTPATMTDHGVFAHAHCPNYLVCRASSLDSVTSWLPQAMSRLEFDHELSGRISFPDGLPLAQAEGAVQRRADLMGELEAVHHVSPVVGAPAPSFEPAGAKAKTRGAA